MSDISTERSVPTGIDALDRVAASLAGDQLFLRGFVTGVESETMPSRIPNEQGTDSPVTLLAEMPAWEDLNSYRGHEQDLRYTVGAVIGAFASRARVDTVELYERLAAPAPTESTVMTFPDYPIIIDPAKRSFTYEGHSLRITKTEFDLARALASRADEVIVREEILMFIRSGDWSNDPHIVDVHRSNLKAKLHRVNCVDPIRTVRGIGLVFDSSPALRPS